MVKHRLQGAIHNLTRAGGGLSEAEQRAEDLDALSFERQTYAEGNAFCSEDDMLDSRGRPLLPPINDAGEPCWW